MACFIQTILQNRPKYFRRWKYVPQICPVWNHQNQLILSLFQWKKLVLSARIRLNKKKMISKISILLLWKTPFFTHFTILAWKYHWTPQNCLKLTCKHWKMFYLIISNELWQNNISLKFCLFWPTLEWSLLTILIHFVSVKSVNSWT